MNQKLCLQPLKKRNVRFKLSVREDLANSMKVFVASRGHRNLSEITEDLLIAFLRQRGVLTVAATAAFALVAGGSR